MASRTKRRPRSDYVSGARRLPNSLRFLEGMRYVALLESTEDGRTRTTVELRPATLKGLIEAASEREDLDRALSVARADIVRLREALASTDTKYAALTEYAERLRQNNGILMERLAEVPDGKPPERSPKSHHDRMTEVGTSPYLRGANGGLPGLGKRRR